MKALLDKLHARMGDFWWYSLMLFCACRAADLLNAFVGLWLVPKYVDPSELGAVTPLGNFAGLLALPVAVFANTFRNEVSRLSIDQEFGKLKTLMRSVFIAARVQHRRIGVLSEKGTLRSSRTLLEPRSRQEVLEAPHHLPHKRRSQ